MDKFVKINIPYWSKKILFDWQNRQSSITTFSWWIKDKSKFRRKNANAQLYSFRKTKLENFWSQVMEAGKINFPNCTKPPKSQNKKKVKLLKPYCVPPLTKIMTEPFHSNSGIGNNLNIIFDVFNIWYFGNLTLSWSWETFPVSFYSECPFK